ncbi:MAG: hypothetical protein M3209_09325 [Acidobacteriota bacterium]|nr:hypothetical protein [Acidobacteriota bacterium]
MNQPTIFLIEEDDDTRPLFKKMLETRNYNVTVSTSDEDARQRVTSTPVEADFVLINLVKSSNEDMLNAGRQIREAGKLAAPLLVIAADYDEEKQGTYDRGADNEYIVYLEDGEELFGLLESLKDGNSSEN